jgi:hypothetical protein
MHSDINQTGGLMERRARSGISGFYATLESRRGMLSTDWLVLLLVAANSGLC